MTQEEKAQAYNEALRKAKDMLSYKEVRQEDMEYLFPELAESEDERIRKHLINCVTRTIPEADAFKEISKEQILAWLEKRGEQRNKINSCKITFEDVLALECSMKTAKITKGGEELYKILVPLYNKIHNAYLVEKQGEQKPMRIEEDEDSNANKETNAPTEYGKYVDKCLNEASKHFFSEGEDKYSVADLFYAGVRCGKSWLEKQGETFTKRDVDDAYLKGVCDAKRELEKQGEQKLANSAKTCKKSQRMISGEAKEALYNKPAWKPSEEQMECLLSEVTAWTKGCPKQKVLESLYNDLMKLKA